MKGALAGVMALASIAGSAPGGPRIPSLFTRRLSKARRCCQCGKVVSGYRYCDCGHRVDPPKGKTPCCKEIGHEESTEERWLLRVSFEAGNIDLTPAGPYGLDEMEEAKQIVLASAKDCYLIEFDRPPDMEAAVVEMEKVRDYLAAGKEVPEEERPSLLHLRGALGMVVHEEDVPKPAGKE